VETKTIDGFFDITGQVPQIARPGDNACKLVKTRLDEMIEQEENKPFNIQ
jgi:hypothetical protein